MYNLTQITALNSRKQKHPNNIQSKLEHKNNVFRDPIYLSYFIQTDGLVRPPI